MIVSWAREILLGRIGIKFGKVQGELVWTQRQEEL